MKKKAKIKPIKWRACIKKSKSLEQTQDARRVIALVDELYHIFKKHKSL